MEAGTIISNTCGPLFFYGFLRSFPYQQLTRGLVRIHAYSSAARTLENLNMFQQTQYSQKKEEKESSRQRVDIARVLHVVTGGAKVALCKVTGREKQTLGVVQKRGHTSARKRDFGEFKWSEFLLDSF